MGGACFASFVVFTRGFAKNELATPLANFCGFATMRNVSHGMKTGKIWCDTFRVFALAGVFFRGPPVASGCVSGPLFPEFRDAKPGFSACAGSFVWDAICHWRGMQLRQGRNIASFEHGRCFLRKGEANFVATARHVSAS